MEIVSINKDKQKSEHDQMWKGKVVQLDIVSYKDGFMAAYIMDCTVEPVPGVQIPHKHCLAKHFVKERWWHKLFGINDEQRCARAVDGLKVKWEIMKDNTTKVDRILERYGVGGKQDE